MAGASETGSNGGARRRQRALEAFRKELAALDAEDIQARLDANRIRSAERQAMARERLRLLRSQEAGAAPEADVGEDRPDGEAAKERKNGAKNGGTEDKEQSHADKEAAAQPASATESAPSRAQNIDNGQQSVIDVAAEVSGAERDDRRAAPLARRIGRLVGMAAAVSGVVLAGAWLVRR